MKRISQAVLAVAAITLIAADSPEKSKRIAPDDAADVIELLRYYQGTIKLERGNIVEIEPLARHLRTEPTVGPALFRLRHVHQLTLRKDDDFFIDVIAKNWISLESVVLYSDVDDRGLADLEGLKNLKAVATYSPYVSDAGVKSIAKHKNLERLIINDAQLTDACMKEIAALPELKWLDLRGNRITDDGLACLRGMRLKELGLFSTRVTNRGVENLKDMTSLKLLEVTDTKVTDAGCAGLRTRIQGLKVWGALEKEVHEIPDDPADVSELQKIPNISAPEDNVTENVYDVDASGFNELPRGWMKHLKGLHYLKRLKLPKETTDSDFRFVAPLKSLEELEVLGDISDEAMRNFEGLARLKLLWCGGKRVTSDGVRHLTPLVNLENLDLGGSSVDDVGLRCLSGMKRLKSLGLSATKVTDAGMAELRALPALEKIYLINTAVTDAGLDTFAV